MQRFAADLLAQQGALVEPIEPEGLEVLASSPVQQALGVNEFFRVGFGATLPAGATRVGIESDWLERFGHLLGQHGRCARVVLHSDARAPSDPQRVLEHALALDNATFRLLDVVPGWTRYVILDFRYSAVSDEKRDGVLRLGVNLATGALPDAVLDQLAPWLVADGAAAALPADADLPPDWQRDRLLELVDRALRPRLDTVLEPFVKVLHRRLERDQERLYAYHNDLHREASRRLLQLAAGEAGRQREEQRIEAIRREYQAKLDDLSRQYAMRVEVEWVQTLELVMAVQRFTVQIRRRKAERVVQLDWNPLARRLETPACEFELRDRSAAAGVRRGAAPGAGRRTGAVRRLRQGILPCVPPGALPPVPTRGPIGYRIRRRPCGSVRAAHRPARPSHPARRCACRAARRCSAPAGPPARCWARRRTARAPRMTA